MEATGRKETGQNSGALRRSSGAGRSNNQLGVSQITSSSNRMRTITDPGSSLPSEWHRGPPSCRSVSTTSDPKLKARVILKSYELSDRVRERDLREMMAEAVGTAEECRTELDRISDLHTPGWRTQLPGSPERVEAEADARLVLGGQLASPSVGPGTVILAIVVVLTTLFFYILSQ